MAKRRANGEGKLRKRDGRWEGRYTTEHAPGTDKAIYRDVLGRIQEENKVKSAEEKSGGVLSGGSPVLPAASCPTAVCFTYSAGC